MKAYLYNNELKMAAEQQGYHSIAVAAKQINKWCIQPPPNIYYSNVIAIVHSTHDSSFACLHRMQN